VNYEVSLQQFSGPLQLLLELIEAEKLPITDVSLSQVTEGYLQHVNEHDIPSEELADFLVIAARLLLLKSRAILPKVELEPEEDAGSLADQLRMYKRFVDASLVIEKMYGAGQEMFAREKTTLERKPMFSPPPSASVQILHTAFTELLKRLEPFFALRQSSIDRVVSVQERIEQIRTVLKDRTRLLFSDMIHGATSKVEVVVSFLALLELMKLRMVRVAQDDSFNDMVIEHVE
jgi:segregation and condensation protein A